MKPYKDPDEFIKNLGAEEYQKRIDEAVGSFFFELQVLEQGFQMEDPEQKTKFFHEVAKKLVGFSDEIERSNYEEAVARQYRIDYDMLHKLVNKYGAQMIVVQGQVVPAATAESNRKTALAKKEREEDKEGITKPQKLLLTWLSLEPSMFRRIQGILTSQDFSVGFCRTVAEMVFEQFEREGSVNPAKIINHFEDKEEQNMAAALFSTEFREEMDVAGQKKAFEDTVRKVKQASIEQSIEEAVESGDMEWFQRLLTEKNRYKNRFPIPE